MTFNPRRPLGAFPSPGPITYLDLDLDEMETMLRLGPFPPLARWYHATTAEVAARAMVEGLIPSCWRGGDSCAVFGRDSMADLPAWHEDSWLIELESNALRGQVKAWWVPPSHIRGVWHRSKRQSIKTDRVPIDDFDGCECELAGLTRNEQSDWRNCILHRHPLGIPVSRH